MVQSYIENYTLKQSKPPIKLQKPTASTESIFRIFSLCCELHLPLLEPLHTHHGAFSRPTELQLVPQPTRLVTNHYIGCIFPLGHHFSLAVLYPKVDFSLSVLPKSQCPAAAYTEPHFRLHIAPPPSPLSPLQSENSLSLSKFAFLRSGALLPRALRKGSFSLFSVQHDGTHRNPPTTP